MLKPQDVVLLLKLLANREHSTWSQSRLAESLCFSLSETNASIKRLIKAKLLRHNISASSVTISSFRPFLNPFSVTDFHNEKHEATPLFSILAKSNTPTDFIGLNEMIRNVKYNFSSEEDMTPESTLKGYIPILRSAQEFLIHGVQYFFPAEMGEKTYGIATSYGAPLFKEKIAIGNSQIPVWPYADGRDAGFSLMPLYPSVPKSIILHPNKRFYDLLILIDALRQGRARERNIAVNLLKEYLEKW